MLMCLLTLGFQWERPPEENWNRDFIIIFFWSIFPESQAQEQMIFSPHIFFFYYDEFLSPEREVISESLEQHTNLSFW